MASSINGFSHAIVAQTPPLFQAPTDVLVQIFKRVGPPDVKSVLCTSKHLYNVFTDDNIWMHLFEAHTDFCFPLLKGITYRSIYVEQYQLSKNRLQSGLVA